MRCHHTVIFAALGLIASPSLADDTALWTAISTQGNLSDRVALMADGNIRISNGWTHFGHYQLRAGLGWRLTKDATLYGGYSYVRSGQAGTAMTDEHRLFQQLSLPLHKSEGWSLASRTRLEQRWRSDGDDMALRVRQQLKLGVPIADNGLQLVVHSELYALLNASDWGGHDRIDQLRSFIGLGVPIGTQFTLEAGYLNAHQFRNGDDRDTHALSLSLGHKF